MTDQTLASCAYCGEELPPYAGRGRRRLHHEGCGWAVQRQQTAAWKAEHEGVPLRLNLRAGVIGDVGPHEQGRYLRAVKYADPCAYCGGEGGSLDHIVPGLAYSEPDPSRYQLRAHVLNLTASCPECNSTKQRTPLLFHLLADRVREDIAPYVLEMNRILDAEADDRMWVRRDGRWRVRRRPMGRRDRRSRD
jgi:hypothetical protein